MGAYKDESGNGTWYCKFSYYNWQGKKINKKKRDFKTKKEALEWEQNFLSEQAGNLDMTFEEFFEVYKRDKAPRIRLNTWHTKENIIKGKAMPYIGNLKMNEISKVTIIQWQNKIMNMVDENGRRYSPTYLRTIHAQLSSVLNHACKYYNLQHNVARQVGNMGQKEGQEMSFWTQEEFEKFINAIKDKSEHYHAFEILYRSGLRMGELIALTKEKFDFKNNTVLIDQSLQRIKGKTISQNQKQKRVSEPSSCLIFYLKV